MKKEESRFFLNWQMPTSISKSLFLATSESERSQICQAWLDYTHITDLVELEKPSAYLMAIIQQFTDLNCDFGFKQHFTEKKLACFLEIMHYMLKQLICQRLSEDDSFEMFKTLLLRHAI